MIAIAACVLMACSGGHGLTGAADGSDDTAGPDGRTDVPADGADTPADPGPDTPADGPADGGDAAGDTGADSPDPVCGNGAVESGEQCDDGNAVEWDGCRECAVVEFQVNTTVDEDQMYPAAAIGDDGFVVVWQSGRDGSFDVLGQTYDAAGAASGPEFRINEWTDDDQVNPDVAMVRDGRFVVSWQSRGQDGDGWGIFGRVYAADGSPPGHEFQVNTYTEDSQSQPSVAMDGEGGFVVAWESTEQDGSDQGVYAQAFGPDGTPVLAEFRVNTNLRYSQAECDVAVAGDGRFVIVWESQLQDGSESGIFAQLYEAPGRRERSEFQVNTWITRSQSTPSASMAPDGTFVVVWRSDGQDGDGWGIYGQEFDAMGMPAGEEFRVNTRTIRNQIHPAVARTAYGRYVVAWSSWSGDGSGYGVFGQRVEIPGTLSGPEFRSNAFTSDDQWVSSVDMAYDGRFVVAWSSYGMDGSGAGVFAQRYDSSGRPLGSIPW